MSLALLLAALTGALSGLLIALPLWRQQRYASSGLLAGVLALACAGLYALLGTPAAVQAGSPAQSAAQDLASNAAQLRQALQADPSQTEGWILLARAEALLGNTTAAEAAWQQALAQAPDEPALLVEAAQARADADPQRRIDDTGLTWLEQARRLDPQAQRALWLIGIAQRQRGQPAAAAQTWQQLLALLDGSTAGSVREQIDIARAQAGLPPLQADQSAAANVDASATAGIEVSLSMDPALAARLPADTPVFVQVRDLAGSPMPVAALRLRLEQLPLTVHLDDGNSVMPGQPLSSHAQVRVSARIAVSGSVSRSEGDIETAASSVEVGSSTPLRLHLQP